MRVLLVYGTTDGHTQKIAGFVADRLGRQGHQLVVANAGDVPPFPDPRAFDTILVAASVHLGRYQAAVVRFVREHRAAISARANAFISVSLSAAGHDPDDVAGLQRCVADFMRSTGWAPRRIHHVAGAFRYTAYHFLTRYVMKYKAYRRGAPTDTRYDYELTDWDDLARFIDRFVCIAKVARA